MHGRHPHASAPPEDFALPGRRKAGLDIQYCSANAASVDVMMLERSFIIVSFITRVWRNLIPYQLYDRRSEKIGLGGTEINPL